MKLWHFLLVIIIATGAGFLGGRIAPPANGVVGVAAEESTYDRVMRTGVIRCGYGLWPPTMIFKDPNTGKLGGIFPEIIEEAAANMNLKIEWTEETGWGSVVESMQSKRFDVFCAPLWPDAERGKLIGYTRAIAYSASHLYARAGDTRFDKDINILNAPEYKLATMDGEMSATIARKFFPKAATVSIPQLGDITQLMLDVASGKADAVFLEPSLAAEFSQKNPGRLRQVTREPYNIFPNAYGVLIGEDKMKDMLDVALGEMLNQGRIDQIITKYEPDHGVFMPVAKPYIYIAPQPLK